MENGGLVYNLPTLEEIRKSTLQNLSDLPEEHKKLTGASAYPVELSPKLRKIKDKLTSQLKSLEGLP
jgi:hypothetical protein